MSQYAMPATSKQQFDAAVDTQQHGEASDQEAGKKVASQVLQLVKHGMKTKRTENLPLSSSIAQIEATCNTHPSHSGAGADPSQSSLSASRLHGSCQPDSVSSGSTALYAALTAAQAYDKTGALSTECRLSG